MNIVSHFVVYMAFGLYTIIILNTYYALYFTHI